MRSKIALFVVLMLATVSAQAQLVPALATNGKSLGFTLLSEESTLGVGTIILTAKVSLNGENITAAAPDTGPFTVPCGLEKGSLIINVRLIAEKLKMNEIETEIDATDKNGRPCKAKVKIATADIKVRYSADGTYQDASFTNDEGWYVCIPLDTLAPDVKVLTFDVMYKAGREYKKLLSFITLSATDAKNRVEAARTMAFAKFAGDATPDGVWNWQTLMGGATLTGQPIPAGGVAPLFTPQSVKDALERAKHPVVPRKGGQTEIGNGDGDTLAQPPTGDLVIKKADAEKYLSSSTGNGSPQGTPFKARPVQIIDEKPLKWKLSYANGDKNDKGVCLYDMTDDIEVSVHYDSTTKRTIMLHSGDKLKFITLTPNLIVTATYFRNGEKVTVPVYDAAAARRQEG